MWISLPVGSVKSPLVWKTRKYMKTFTTQINNRIYGNTEKNSKASLYYNVNELNKLETTKTQFSLMHLNISSLRCHFEKLDDLLNTSKQNSMWLGYLKDVLRKVFLYCQRSIFKIIKLNILQQSLKKVRLYYAYPQI